MAFLRSAAELMRLPKPVGILNIFFPYMYGFFHTALVSKPNRPVAHTLLYQFPLLFFQAFILRSVGCVWNDIVDVDIDKLVARTKTRPLPRGAISPRAAYLLSLGLFAIWVTCLTHLLPDPVRLAAYAVPLVGMVIAYPYMKRVTNYAQVFLGVTLGWGVLLGAAIAGFDALAHLSQAASSAMATANSDRLLLAFADPRLAGLLALYAAYVTWAVIHDTIYAFQDYKDDKVAGVKSMALRLSGSTKPILWALSEVQVLLLVAACLSMVPESQAGKFSNGLLDALALLLGVLHWRWIFLGVAVLGNAVLLSLMVGKVDLSDPLDCARWFRTGSIWIGSTIGLGFFLEYLWQVT